MIYYVISEEERDRANGWLESQGRYPLKTSLLAEALKKERERVMDEFGIIHGEDAKRLYDYMQSK